MALVRESRGARGRLLFFLLCLSVGVAAVVAVKAFSASLEAGVRSQARELLAADVVVSARRNVNERPSDVWRDIEDRWPGVRVAETREMLSVVSAQKDLLGGASLPGLGLPGLGGAASSQLVELKAVSAGYPFYGSLDVAPSEALERLQFDPERPGALVAPELLEKLRVAPGDVILIGGSPFVIVGVVRSEPDRLASALALAPRVMVAFDALEKTRLVNEMNRASYAALIAVPETVDLAALTSVLKERLSLDEFRVETFREARPELREALNRLSSFLGLVALLSLLVGGVGVAQTVRSWLATRWDSIAVYKSLGVRPRELLAIYGLQAGLLAAAGSGLGALIGGLLQLLIPRIWSDIVPAGLVRPWQPWPIAQGFLLGVLVALAFSLPPLLVVVRVPAARVLRRDSEPLPRSRGRSLLLLLFLGAVVFLVAVVQAAGIRGGAVPVGAAFTAAVGVTVLLLVGASKLMVRLVGGSRRAAAPRSPTGVALRYGIAAVARPGAGALSAIVALGLGLLVVLTMVLVERALTEQLKQELPLDAPTMFLMGIEEAQWPALESLLEGSGSEIDRSRQVRSVPVLMAQLLEVDGRTPKEILSESEDRSQRWATRRQLRVTPLQEMPADSSLAPGGRWFSDDGVFEASLEKDFAESLGVGMGSTLRLEVQGVRRVLNITSIRTVDWESFNINFFVIVEPGAFPQAQPFRLATVKSERDSEQGLQDQIAAGFPNVTVIRVREVLDKVVEILGRLGWGVQFLGLFTVVSALVILAGSVAATAARRGREAALLKTLGMTRRNVLLAFATEYALLGWVAAVVACVGASISSWVVTTRVLEIDWHFQPGPIALAVVVGVSLAVLGGALASLGAVRRRPLDALRAE